MLGLQKAFVLFTWLCLLLPLPECIVTQSLGRLLRHPDFLGSCSFISFQRRREWPGRLIFIGGAPVTVCQYRKSMGSSTMTFMEKYSQQLSLWDKYGIRELMDVLSDRLGVSHCNLHPWERKIWVRKPWGWRQAHYTFPKGSLHPCRTQRSTYSSTHMNMQHC